jgi:hypothetical protein
MSEGSEPSAIGTRQHESPKRFFRLLRAEATYWPKLFSQHLAAAGFQVHRIAKQPNHAHVWEAHLKRGTVPAGWEAEAARREISAFLKRSDFKCPKSEIDVLTRGDRIMACWIFLKGVAGCLSCCAGREQWLSPHGWLNMDSVRLERRLSAERVQVFD